MLTHAFPPSLSQSHMFGYYFNAASQSSCSIVSWYSRTQPVNDNRGFSRMAILRLGGGGGAFFYLEMGASMCSTYLGEGRIKAQRSFLYQRAQNTQHRWLWLCFVFLSLFYPFLLHVDILPTPKNRIQTNWSCTFLHIFDGSHINFSQFAADLCPYRHKIIISKKIFLNGCPYTGNIFTFKISFTAHMILQ